MYLPRVRSSMKRKLAVTRRRKKGKSRKSLVHDSLNSKLSRSRKEQDILFSSPSPGRSSSSEDRKATQWIDEENWHPRVPSRSNPENEKWHIHGRSRSNPEHEKAQIMLGMVQPPQEIPTMQEPESKQPESTQPIQQQHAQDAHSLQNQMGIQDQTGAFRTQPPSMRMQQVTTFSHQAQTMAMPTHQTLQQSKGHLTPQVPSTSLSQSCQHQSIPQSTLHSAPQPTPLQQPQMSAASSQLPQPLQTLGISHMPLQQPTPPQPRLPLMPNYRQQYAGFHPHSTPRHLTQPMYPYHQPIPPQLPSVPNYRQQYAGFQSHSTPRHLTQPMYPYHQPIPPQPRLPSMPNYRQQYAGFQPHSTAQPMYHPPLPSHPPPQPKYQAGGEQHFGTELNNQGGNSMQVDRRGSSWMSGPSENPTVTQLPGPPSCSAPAQTVSSSQPAQMHPEMEKGLLQQVPEERNKVLQLQQTS